MPVEIIKVAFKPVNFFDKNPALDVPPSKFPYRQNEMHGELERVLISVILNRHPGIQQEYPRLRTASPGHAGGNGRQLLRRVQDE